MHVFEGPHPVTLTDYSRRRILVAVTVLQQGLVALIPGMKNPREALVGDTFFQLGKSEGLEPLPGFEEGSVFLNAFYCLGLVSFSECVFLNC